MSSIDLEQICEPLAERLAGISIRAKAALFGSLGYALLPVLREVEVRSMRRWTFPEAEKALLIARDFAVGYSPARNNGDLRDRLLESVPNGHDLDSPWSTYAMDAIVCIDAALVAASADLQNSFRNSWIHYALEPWAVTLNPIGYEIAPDLLDKGTRLRAAVDFLDGALSDLSQIDEITGEDYGRLVRQAVVISPR